jgi:NADH:ubiquinone oxidoreductase subunit 3 (subunit A)
VADHAGNYFPVFVFILIGIAFGVAPVITGLVVAPHRPDSENCHRTNAASRLSKMRA